MDELLEPIVHDTEQVRAMGHSAPFTDDDGIVVIGSHAILGQFSNAPEEFRVSREADVYPRNHR